MSSDSDLGLFGDGEGCRRSQGRVKEHCKKESAIMAGGKITSKRAAGEEEDDGDCALSLSVLSHHEVSTTTDSDGSGKRKRGKRESLFVPKSGTDGRGRGISLSCQISRVRRHY